MINTLVSVFNYSPSKMFRLLLNWTFTHQAWLIIKCCWYFYLILQSLEEHIKIQLVDNIYDTSFKTHQDKFVTQIISILINWSNWNYFIIETRPSKQFIRDKFSCEVLKLNLVQSSILVGINSLQGLIHFRKWVFDI